MFKKIINPISFGIASLILVELVILPGLKSPHIGVRILMTLLLSVLLISLFLVLIYSIWLSDQKKVEVSDIPEGETEIDYIPYNELKSVKKKK
jgi:hypothetical protein